MTATRPTERTIVAPEMLGLPSRSAFRESAVRLLDELPEGEGRLIIDLSGTNRVDSSGLGALMLVQRRASDRRQAVVLRNPSEEVRFLLTLTKLRDLFELDEVPSARTRR